MKTRYIPLLLLLASCSAPPKPVEEAEILFADPTIYVEGGKFYLTGTRNIEPIGFTMLESADLKTWTPVARPDTSSLILAGGSHTFGYKGFWAPQIVKHDGIYLYAYTANEQVAIARSQNLVGPYLQDSIAPVDGSEKNIDPYLFCDDDGSYYLYHVRFNHGNYIWVASFDPATGHIDPTTLTQCLSQTEDWEATPNYKSVPIMEGPTVIKLEDKYYLFYSANHFRNVDYAVGYATADSPYGPWTKHPASPIIHRSIVGENGSGHGDLFFDAKQRPYYVYHVHHNDTMVTPRRTRIVPLRFDRDSESGIYTITAEGNKVIRPKVK
jgi:beta-xylosidase